MKIDQGADLLSMKLEVNNSQLNMKNLRIELGKQVAFECSKLKLKFNILKNLCMFFSLSFNYCR